MKISFLGGAKVVTGTNILIETDNEKILLDCGLFQGSEELERLNHENFDFNPKEINYLILSHAHIDHSGRIPKLVKEGFRGDIYSTNATYELSEIMLKDSGYIQESDIKWLNKSRQRSGKEPLHPLYTVEDAENSLRYFKPILYNQKIDISENISLRFKDAGHILGSSIVELWLKENGKTNKIVFSGDLGTKNKPLIKDPELVEDVDYLILESTYGDRKHENTEYRMNKLMDIINKTVLRNGTVIIPSFAVGRTQELIYELYKYYKYNNNIEEFLKIPIYIDSPMAISATKIFKNNSYCFDDEAKKYILEGNNPLNFENLYYIRDHKESMRLNEADYPKVIISASGMCTAGRIRHHLKHNIWKKKNSVVFVGYQAEGTLGKTLQNGAKSVRILGEQIAVLSEIYSVEGFSGHADMEGLLNWVDGIKNKPKKIFLTHGEESSSNHLRNKIQEKYNIKTHIPMMGDSYKIKNDSLEEEANILKPIRQKEDIKKELEEVLNQFEALEDKTDKFLDDIILEEKYDKIKNKLISLQRELMDIKMLVGD